MVQKITTTTTINIKNKLIIIEKLQSSCICIWKSIVSSTKELFFRLLWLNLKTPYNLPNIFFEYLSIIRTHTFILCMINFWKWNISCNIDNFNFQIIILIVMFFIFSIQIHGLKVTICRHYYVWHCLLSTPLQ